MKQSFFARTGLILAGLVVLNFCLMTILALQQHLIVAYANFWGLPIFTSELVVLSIVTTVVWFWAIYRFWNWRGDTA